MTLFFETGHQSVFFLSSVVLGFLIAHCLCCGGDGGVVRFAADILLLMLGSVGLVLLLAVLGDSRLRLYHFLGAVCGAFLYMHGFGSLIKRLKNIWFLKRTAYDGGSKK